MANTIITPALTGLTLSPQVQQFQGDNVATTITFPVAGTVPTAFTRMSVTNSVGADISSNIFSQTLVGNNINVVLNAPFPDIYTFNYTITQPPAAAPPLNVTVVSGTVTSITNPVAVSTVGSVTAPVTAVQGSPAVPANAWPTKLVDAAGVNEAAVSATGAVKVDGSSVTQPISAVSLPLPTGAAQLPTYTSFSIANPAAGAAAVVTVPAGQQWKITQLYFVLVTSATAATRVAVISSVDASSKSMGWTVSSQPQTASLGYVYTFGNGLAAAGPVPAGFAAIVTQPMPSLVLGPGATLNITASNLQAADQISVVNVMIEVTT